MKTLNEIDLAIYLNKTIIEPLSNESVADYYPFFIEFLGNPDKHTYQQLHAAMGFEENSRSKHKLPDILPEESSQEAINFLALFTIGELIGFVEDELEPQTLSNDINKKDLLVKIREILTVVETASLALTGLILEQECMQLIVKKLEDIKEALELSIEFESWKTAAA